MKICFWFGTMLLTVGLFAEPPAMAPSAVFIGLACCTTELLDRLKDLLEEERQAKGIASAQMAIVPRIEWRLRNDKTSPPTSQEQGIGSDIGEMDL